MLTGAVSTIVRDIVILSHNLAKVSGSSSDTSASGTTVAFDTSLSLQM
jgi:hypothetical protein